MQNYRKMVIGGDFFIKDYQEVPYSTGDPLSRYITEVSHICSLKQVYGVVSTVPLSPSLVVLFLVLSSPDWLCFQPLFRFIITAPQIWTSLVSI